MSQSPIRIFKGIFILATLLIFSNCTTKPKKIESLGLSENVYLLQKKTFYYKVYQGQSLIDTIMLIISPRFDSNLKQGIVAWNYLPFVEESNLDLTGVIENDSVVWLHPPRKNFYCMLGILAFPTIQKPFEKGVKWKWDLEVSDIFACKEQGLNWVGLLKCSFEYEITDIRQMIVMNESVVCFQVSAKSHSIVGDVTSEFIYNTKYGFVELNYFIPNDTLRLKIYQVFEKRQLSIFGDKNTI